MVSMPGQAGSEAKENSKPAAQYESRASASSIANQPIGVEVPEEIGDLKKYQTGDPDSRPASKPGKNDLRQQGLHLKKKKRAQKDGATPHGDITQTLRCAGSVGLSK